MTISTITSKELSCEYRYMQGGIDISERVLCKMGVTCLRFFPVIKIRKEDGKRLELDENDLRMIGCTRDFKHFTWL